MEIEPDHNASVDELSGERGAAEIALRICRRNWSSLLERSPFLLNPEEILDGSASVESREPLKSICLDEEKVLHRMSNEKDIDQNVIMTEPVCLNLISKTEHY